MKSRLVPDATVHGGASAVTGSGQSPPSSAQRRACSSADLRPVSCFFADSEKKLKKKKMAIKKRMRKKKNCLALNKIHLLLTYHRHSEKISLVL